MFGFYKRLHWKDIRIPDRLHTTTTPGTFIMKWLTSCLLPRQRDTKCRQKRLRLNIETVWSFLSTRLPRCSWQSFSPTRHLSWSYPESPRIVPSSSPYDKVRMTSTLFVSIILVSEFVSMFVIVRVCSHFLDKHPFELAFIFTVCKTFLNVKRIVVTVLLKK